MTPPLSRPGAPASPRAGATPLGASSASDPGFAKAQAQTSESVFADGNANVPGCQCDRDGRLCEMPCWQRVGLIDQPCCPGCPPLPPVPGGDRG